MVNFEDLMMQADSYSAISTYLSLRPPLLRYYKFRQYVIFHKNENLIEVLRQTALELDFKLSKTNDRLDVFWLVANLGKENEVESSGWFIILPGSQPNFYRLITISRSEFWNSVTRLVRRLYPEAMPVFFKQEETKDALLTLHSALGRKFRIVIRDVTMKRNIVTGTRRKTARVETDRLWTRLPIEEIYAQALEGGFWFTGIGFDVEKLKGQTNRYSLVSKGRIYKYGVINYNSLHTEIDQSAVQVLEKYASSRLSFLEQRGIRERNYIPAAPIQITYGRDLFNETSEVRRFGEVIAHYPHSTRAIFHANPYYHASVADFLDGSSFELWILSPRRVLIAPQAKCSEKALERLISHIFFEYNEGELGEYRRTE